MTDQPLRITEHDLAIDAPTKYELSEKLASSSFGSLLFNVIIPIAILMVGASVIAALGSIEPKGRPDDDPSLAGRMRRLPAAEVTKVLSLNDFDKPLELRVDGVVVPFREVAIAAEVAGRIVKKSPACEAGSIVKKGDLLVEIDSTDYEQEVERVTRMREQEYEGLKEVDQELANTRRMVDIAKEDVKLQQREVKRLESMPNGFASEGEFDKAKKSLLMAVQTEISYDNQMNLLAAKRNKLEASERMATTQLHSAEINLERTKIYSPVDGVIVRENAELNSFIQRGSPIVTLNDVTKAEVAVNLRMDQLQWVLDQQRGTNDHTTEAADAQTSTTTKHGYTLPPTPAVIEYEMAGRSDKVFRWHGTLVRYDGIGLDTRSRTVPVLIIVDQPQQFEGGNAAEITASSPSPLVRGMFVSVRLLIRPKTSLVAIPSVAIQPGNRVWQFVADDSVLDAVSTEKPSTSQASETAGAVKSTTDDFNPAAWQAGRVLVRRGVVPVDSLWLPVGKDESEIVGTKSGERRYWICEIAGGEVKGGDWAVTTPLGDFDSELSVRVPVQ